MTGLGSSTQYRINEGVMYRGCSWLVLAFVRRQKYGFTSHSLTYSLHGAKVLLQKLTGSQLVKKFSKFYGTWCFITAFTSAHHLSLSWASSIQSIPPQHPYSWISISVLTYHLRLSLSSGLFHSGFRTKTLHSPLLSPHACYMSRQSHSTPLYHPNNIGWAVWIRKTD